MKVLLSLAGCCLAALVASGCGGGSKNASSSPTVSGAASTGVPQLDTVIAVVERRDSTSFRQLLEFTPMACTDELGEGGPPKCAAGEAKGTNVTVFRFQTCAIDWRTETTVDSAVAELMAIVPKRYAAFKPATAYSVGGDYVAVFEGPDPRTNGTGSRGAAVAVSNGRVVGLWLQCGAAGGVDGLIPAGQTALLLPPPH